MLFECKPREKVIIKCNKYNCTFVPITSSSWILII